MALWDKQMHRVKLWCEKFKNFTVQYKITFIDALIFFNG